MNEKEEYGRWNRKNNFEVLWNPQDRADGDGDEDERRENIRQLTTIDKLTTQIHQQINDGATNKKRTAADTIIEL